MYFTLIKRLNPLYTSSQNFCSSDSKRAHYLDYLVDSNISMELALYLGDVTDRFRSSSSSFSVDDSAAPLDINHWLPVILKTIFLASYCIDYPKQITRMTRYRFISWDRSELCLVHPNTALCIHISSKLLRRFLFDP